jgi:hypothetical protein
MFCMGAPQRSAVLSDLPSHVNYRCRREYAVTVLRNDNYPPAVALGPGDASQVGNGCAQRFSPMIWRRAPISDIIDGASIAREPSYLNDDRATCGLNSGNRLVLYGEILQLSLALEILVAKLCHRDRFERLPTLNRSFLDYDSTRLFDRGYIEEVLYGDRPQIA